MLWTVYNGVSTEGWGYLTYCWSLRDDDDTERSVWDSAWERLLFCIIAQPSLGLDSGLKYWLLCTYQRCSYLYPAKEAFVHTYSSLRRHGGRLGGRTLLTDCNLAQVVDIQRPSYALSMSMSTSKYYPPYYWLVNSP